MKLNRREIHGLLTTKDRLKEKKPIVDNSEKLQKLWIKTNKIKKG